MDILTQLPAAPAGYDAVANSGWLGAHALYVALLPGLSASQVEAAGAILDDLQARQRLANANALAAIGQFKAVGEVLVIGPADATTANAA